MRPRTSIQRACLCALVGCLIHGCRSQAAPPPRKAISRIALVGLAKDHPSFSVMESTARAVAGPKGRLEIIVLAPDHDTPIAQHAILNSLADSTIDALCVHPIDPVSIGPILDEQVRRGMPVVTFGCDVPRCTRGAYCGPFEGDVGRITATACALLATSESRSFMLLYAGADHPFYEMRYNAFKSQLPAVKDVSLMREIDCHANRLEALERVRAEFRKYPRVAGWILLDDWPLRALPPGERLLPKGCRVLLCSSDPSYYGDLEAGRIDAMIGYDYREAVLQALHAAVRLGDDLKSGFGSQVNMAPQIITRDSLPAWRQRWQAWQSGQPTPP